MGVANHYATNLVTSFSRFYIMLNKNEADNGIEPLSAIKSDNYIFVNSSLLGYFSGDFLKLFRSQFQLFPCEIDVFFALDRDQMDVCMRDFEP